MRVIRQRLDDVGTGMNEVAMQLRHHFRMLQHHLRHECAGLQIAATLEFEHIALRADHGALREPFHQRRFSLVCHQSSFWLKAKNIEPLASQGAKLMIKILATTIAIPESSRQLTASRKKRRDTR